jgi:hypothetical protein
VHWCADPMEWRQRAFGLRAVARALRISLDVNS